MRSVSVRLADLENIKINLGYVGENEHVHILFDCKKAFDQYPNAVPSMVVVPPKGDSYPAVVTREGDIVEWVVTDSDLIYNGNGKIQLQFEQNDVVMKSAEARTFIAPSSIPTGTIPTPIQNWIAQANAILAEIPEDINSALAAAKASGEFDGDDGVGIASIAKTGTSGLVDTYTITLTNGNHYDIDVTNGTPGQNGVGIQNIAKTSTVGLVDTYTITLTNGQTYTFTVTNGQNGVEIDDTTPAVNKVFSSSKVDEEITDVKTAIQGKYTNPSGGIPASDMSEEVQNTLSGVGKSENRDGIVQSTNTATKNITSGQYVIWNGSLYTASANIAIGETLSLSNLDPVDDGGFNDLKTQIINMKKEKFYQKFADYDGSYVNLQQLVPFDVYDEIVILIYQSNASETAWSNTDWNAFFVQGENNSNIAAASYLKGSVNHIIHIKRYKEVVTSEFVNNKSNVQTVNIYITGNSEIKLKRIRIDAVSSTIKAGCTMEVYVF